MRCGVIISYNLRANHDIQTFRTTVDTGDEVEVPARA